MERRFPRAELIPAMIAAMVRSERPSIREACAAFGRATVLRQLVSLIDRGEDLPLGAVRAWLSEACSDANVVEQCLCQENFTSSATLDALARTVAPDFVPNDFGDDSWLIAFRRTAGSDVTQYLASFLLTRAFGRRTRSSAELIQCAFDTVYMATERSVLPDDAWRLLDDRLYRSYFWPNWDRCQRIRQTTVDLFVDRGLEPRDFVEITVRDDIFSLLVDVAAHSYGGRRYLRWVRDWLFHDGAKAERLRTVERAT
jgi:hypothetical protein